MTREQLVRELGKRFYRVGVVEQAEQDAQGLAIRRQEGFNWYLVAFYERRGDVLLRRHHPIYVENEGTPNERAFFGESVVQDNLIPAPPEANPFENVEGEVERRGRDFVVVKRFVIEGKEAVERRFLVKLEKGRLIEFPIRQQIASAPIM